MKKSDIKRLQPGDKLKMIFGYLAGTPNAIRTVAKVQSNAIAFDAVRPDGTPVISWLRLDQQCQEFISTDNGFEVWAKSIPTYDCPRQKLLAYELVK